MKRLIVGIGLIAAASGSLCREAYALLPEGLASKTFYDTTKVRFDGIMWFEEIPGRPGYFLVAEQSGKVWAFHPASLAKTLYMNLPAYTQDGYHEDGLLGLAFHPKFRENRKLYAYYSPASKRSVLVIGEMTAGPTFLEDSGLPIKTIWSMPNLGSHNGATVAFGPDGYLYWAKGQDHGQPGTSQDLKNTRGKMFRIDVDRPEGGKAYGIPADNPFGSRTDGTIPEIWAYGFRNPMKFTWDALTGELWETEVGQWYFENVNRVKAGGNYGWDIMEGTNCYSWSDEYRPLASCNSAAITPPVWSIPHVNPKDAWGNSGTGGVIYRSNTRSGFYGKYIFGDFCSKQLFALTPPAANGAKPEVKEYARLPLGPMHFTTTSDGKVYFAGWYYSSVNLSTNRSSQILMLDHPDLNLGASASRPDARPARRDSRAAVGRFQKLPGIPAGYYVGGTRQDGSQIRYYSIGGARRFQGAAP